MEEEAKTQDSESNARIAENGSPAVNGAEAASTGSPGTKSAHSGKPDALKSWLPSLFLVVIMFFLIASVRLYINCPDGFELVWKGELSFKDTVVDLNTVTGLPRREFADRKALLEQMEEMGLYDANASDYARPRKKKGSQFRPRKVEPQKESGSDIDENEAAGQFLEDSGKESAGKAADKKDIDSDKD